MQAVPRRDWIEFLDALEIDGEVDLVSAHLPQPADGGWMVRAADFDPFDHVIEIILDNQEVTVRLLIDDPRVVSFEGDARSPSKIEIESSDGVVAVAARRQAD